MSVTAWLAASGALALGARALLHHGIRRALAAPRTLAPAVPEGLLWRDVSIATMRGKTLRGWFIPAGPAAPALAIMHGWGGNAGTMLPLAGPLHRAGYTLLLFDARCHGRSDADDFASLPRFAEDLQNAVDWLAQQPEVDPERIGCIGHSVGAGAALLTAARDPRTAAVVSLSAFAHPQDMMRRWLAARRIPYRPFGAYVLRYVQRVIGHRFDDIAPQTTIGAIACPVLLVHGDQDDTVPLEDAYRIHARRRGTNVQLAVFPGGHEGAADIEAPLRRIIDFLDTALSHARDGVIRHGSEGSCT